MIFSADHTIVISLLSNLIPTSSVINVAQVSTHISFRISFLRSQNHGAFTGITFSIHLILFKTNVLNASQSISSAMTIISRFH